MVIDDGERYVALWIEFEDLFRISVVLLYCVIVDDVILMNDFASQQQGLDGARRLAHQVPIQLDVDGQRLLVERGCIVHVVNGS